MKAPELILAVSRCRRYRRFFASAGDVEVVDLAAAQDLEDCAIGSGEVVLVVLNVTGSDGENSAGLKGDGIDGGATEHPQVCRRR